MSEATATAPSQRSSFELSRAPLLAWRNLWRNRRRSWLTIGGISFAIVLVGFFKALQLGSYAQMEANSTSLLTGHVQVQTAAYAADEKFADTIPGVNAKLQALAGMPGVQHALPRVEAFALVSVGERSFGARIMGVDLQRERAALRYLKNLAAGEFPQGPDQTVIGSVLARNLGAQAGDELVVLGSAKRGGVAAMVFTISGIVSTGVNDLDRVLAIAPLATVQAGYELDDEAHSLVLLGATPAAAGPLQQRAQSELALLAQQAAPSGAQPGPQLRVRPWGELLPDVKQSIDLDRVSADLIYLLLLGLVVFTVINSFIMTIFERTREFGMLRAIGMRPGKILGLLQWESFFVWLVGAVLGTAIAGLLVLWLARAGIPLGESVQQMAQQVYMPDRLFPLFSWDALGQAPVVLFFGCQLASLLPGLRIFRLQPVEALRDV